MVSTATTTRTRQEGDSIERTDRDGQLALVDAARAAGAGHFVLVSYSGQIPETDPLTRAKRAVERHVIESGMTYAIMRPSIFMEVWLSPALGFDWPSARATIFGSGENPVSWVSLFDVAELTARAAVDATMRNATIEFGGPEALTPLAVVRVFEEAMGRRFQVQLVPDGVLAAQRDAATDSLGEAFAALMLAYARGDAHDMTEVLRRFPLQMRTLRAYAAECARQVASPASPASTAAH